MAAQGRLLCIKLFSSGSNEVGLGGGGGGGLGVYGVHCSMSADHEHLSGDFVERSMSRDSSAALMNAIISVHIPYL